MCQNSCKGHTHYVLVPSRKTSRPIPKILQFQKYSRRQVLPACLPVISSYTININPQVIMFKSSSYETQIVPDISIVSGPPNSSFGERRTPVFSSKCVSQFCLPTYPCHVNWNEYYTYVSGDHSSLNSYIRTLAYLRQFLFSLYTYLYTRVYMYICMCVYI